MHSHAMDDVLDPVLQQFYLSSSSHSSSENDSFSRENDFRFRSHGDFTATSRPRDSERPVVGNVFA